MDNARQWQMISTVAVGGFLTAFIVAGCGGGSGGSLFSEGNGNGTPTPVPTTSGTPTKTPVGTPKATPLRTPVGTPTPGPTSGGTPLPTPVPNSLYTSFGVIGSLDASGTFTQTAGFFSQSRLVRSTGPTPTPIGGGTPEPTPTPLSATLYTGTYALSNGEKGIFSLLVPSGQQASGGGAPAVDISGYTLQPVTQGDAVVTLKINGSTGSGTVTLGTVATGTIQITSKQSFLRAGNTYRHLLKLMKR
ncbi:MAG: hypothetical protein JO316_01855 [Abitibacteriaceae bacterium]|nr:hypothetical protein [Abditibacteriaceae bacterium]